MRLCQLTKGVLEGRDFEHQLSYWTGRLAGARMSFDLLANGLDVELARDRQKRLAAEEILREIDLAFRGAREVGEIQRRDSEQGSRALGVRTRDDRRIDPEKALLIEEPVDRPRQAVAHPRRGADHVRARPQM